MKTHSLTLTLLSRLSNLNPSTDMAPGPCNLYSTVLSTTVNAIYSFNWFKIYHNNWLYIRIYIYPKHILGEFASIYRRIWWFPKKWHVSVISVGISKIVYNNNIICSVPDSQIIRIYVCIHIRILYLSYIVCHISYIYMIYVHISHSPTHQLWRQIWAKCRPWQTNQHHPVICRASAPCRLRQTNSSHRPLTCSVVRLVRDSMLPKIKLLTGGWWFRAILKIL